MFFFSLLFASTRPLAVEFQGPSDCSILKSGVEYLWGSKIALKKARPVVSYTCDDTHVSVSTRKSYLSVEYVGIWYGNNLMITGSCDVELEGGKKIDIQYTFEVGC